MRRIIVLSAMLAAVIAALATPTSALAVTCTISNGAPTYDGSGIHAIRSQAIAKCTGTKWTIGVEAESDQGTGFGWEAYTFNGGTLANKQMPQQACNPASTYAEGSQHQLQVNWDNGTTGLCGVFDDSQSWFGHGVDQNICYAQFGFGNRITYVFFDGSGTQLRVVHSTENNNTSC